MTLLAPHVATRVIDGYLRHDQFHALAQACGPYRSRLTVTCFALQRMLGHASATLTLDRYGHLFPDELDGVAARLDEAAHRAGVYRM